MTIMTGGFLQNLAPVKCISYYRASYELWSDNTAFVVLGQHWCALDLGIYECQSATSFIFGFIFSFSSWVNFEFVEVL